MSHLSFIVPSPHSFNRVLVLFSPVYFSLPLLMRSLSSLLHLDTRPKRHPSFALDRAPNGVGQPFMLRFCPHVASACITFFHADSHT